MELIGNVIFYLPFILIPVFFTCLIGSKIYREKNPGKAEKFHKIRVVTGKIIYGYILTMLILLLVGAVFIMLFGVPAQQ